MSSTDQEPNMVIVRHIIEQINFSGFPVHIQLKIGRSVVLHVRMNTQDRDTGVPTFIEGQYLIPSYFQFAYQSEAICTWVAERVMDLIRHELLECLRFNGQRIFDPHKPAAKPTTMMPSDVLADLMPHMKRG